MDVAIEESEKIQDMMDEMEDERAMAEAEID